VGVLRAEIEVKLSFTLAVLSLKTAKKEKQDELKATGSSKSYPMLWVK
jgi:hypothetical protein